MAIVVSTVESVNALPFEVGDEQRVVLQVLLTVLAQCPDSRILLWATLFVLQHIGVPQKELARWFGCVGHQGGPEMPKARVPRYSEGQGFFSSHPDRKKGQWTAVTRSMGTLPSGSVSNQSAHASLGSVR